MDSSAADVIVIGAGIGGASLAAELAPRCRVLLLEMEAHPGYHTTGRSAAMFAEGYGSPVIRRLTRASRAFLESPPAGFAEHPLLTPRGWLFVADAARGPSLEKVVDEIHGSGGSMRPVPVEEALRRVPILSRDWLAAAALDETARDIDVHGLLQGFLRKLRAAGGALRTDAKVLSLERRSGAWKVETTAGTFTAAKVVNAAGAWAGRLGLLAGAVDIGLAPLRRTAVILDPPAGADVSAWPLVVDAEERFYFKPDGGRLLASPCDETPTPPCDASPEDEDVAIAVDRVTTACDLQVRRVGHRWAGLRSFVADRNPVVGFDPQAEDFFWLAGQGGYGIQIAPALARAGAALLEEHILPADLAEAGMETVDISPCRAIAR